MTCKIHLYKCKNSYIYLEDPDQAKPVKQIDVGAMFLKAGESELCQKLENFVVYFDIDENGEFIGLEIVDCR